VRRLGSVCASRIVPATTAATPNVTPPTQVELSNPATTTSASVTTWRGLGRSVIRPISSIASTTQEAAVMCWGTQAAWNSQPPKPVLGETIARSVSAPSSVSSTVRADAVAAKSSAHSAVEARSLNQTASPIIRASALNAENQVSAMSASHPLTPGNAASSAAVKCQR
jgi:hypothetical protein